MIGPLVRSAALVCVSAVVATACTGDDRAPGPSATAVGDLDPTDAVVDPGATEAPVFNEGDEVLNVAISEPATLDPMRIQDPGSALAARQLYEGLTRWNPTLERVEPAAAESWSASSDGATFVFRLRQGMSFHDGSPVTSHDFRFAFDRIALKENAADLAYTLDKVAGFEEVNRLGTSRHLAGLATPDPLTFVIRLSEPYHDLPAILTHPGLVPLPESAVRDVDRFLTHPVGNGPFRIADDWHPGGSVILEAFPGFIQTPDLDGIRLVAYPDAAASWVEFLTGDPHVAEVPAGQVEDAERRFGSDGFKPFLKSEYYGFNLKSPALDDIRMRKAINFGIDRAQLSRTVYRGTMQLPRGIIPTGLPGFRENLCVDLCKFDPARARRLVSSLPRDERTVRIDYTKGEPHDAAARSIRGDLRRIGLEVRIKGHPFPTYLRRLRDGEQAAYRLGWIAESPTADTFLTPLFSSNSPDNHSGFSSPKVDRLLDEAHRARSDDKRLQLYVQAEKEILRSYPVVPIGSFVTRWAAQDDVRGIEFDVMGGFDAVGVFLAEEGVGGNQ